MTNPTNLGQRTYPQKKNLGQCVHFHKRKRRQEREGATLPSMCLAVRDKRKERN